MLSTLFTITNLCYISIILYEGFGSAGSNQCPVKNIAFDGDLESFCLTNCSLSDSTMFENSVICATCPSESSCLLGSAGGGPIYDEKSDVLVGVMSSLKDYTNLTINPRISNELTWIIDTICTNQIQTSDIPTFCSTSETTWKISRREGSLRTLDIASETLSTPLGVRSECASDELYVLVLLNTDDSGDQTIWQITNNRDNQIVESGSGYAKNSPYNIAICLSNVIEYTFTIFYNWSNFYYLLVDGTTVSSGNRIWATGQVTVFGSFATCVKKKDCNDKDKCTKDKCDKKTGDCKNTYIKNKCCTNQKECKNTFKNGVCSTLKCNTNKGLCKKNGTPVKCKNANTCRKDKCDA